MEVKIKSTPMTTNSMNVRSVQFAGKSVTFDIDAPEILKAVDAHFKHCFGEDKIIVAEYQVRAGGEAGFSIFRDGEKFQSNLNVDQVLFQLMQDGLTKLNGAVDEGLVFHAAALAYNDRGLLLCGKSGSGKSTLTAWLTASGYQYLTDEVIALPLHENHIGGFCRSLVLKNGSRLIWEKLISQTKMEHVLKMTDGSAWIPPTTLNSSAMKVAVEPRLILFPTYTADAEFKAEQLTAAGTLFHLLQCLVNARNFSDYGMERTKELAKTVSAYRVIYSDIEQVSEWVQRTII